MIHSSEYSLDKDRRQEIRLMCPNLPPQAEPSQSGIQFRWLHIQRQFLRLDDLNKLVINSPYISNELRAIALNVLSDVKTRASRRLAGSLHVNPGSVVRGTSSYDTGDDLQNQHVIFFSSPYLLLSKKPSITNAEKGQCMSSLLESLYGYDVESDGQDTGLMKMMSLKPSNSSLHVPQLWCLLVGNDVLITLSDLSVQDMTEDLIEIDQKVLSLRRPLTVKVLDQYRRPHSVVIDADCNYVDFLRHTFALAKAGTDACVTDYELLDENGDLVTPQKWLTLIQQGKLEDLMLYIVPRSQKQLQLRRSQSRSRSRPRYKKRQQEMSGNDHRAMTGYVQRPPGTKIYGSQSRVSQNEAISTPAASIHDYKSENRTISSKSNLGRGPEQQAFKDQQNTSEVDPGNPGSLTSKNQAKGKVVTWEDQADRENNLVDEEELRGSNQMGSISRDKSGAAKDMQLILRRPTGHTSNVLARRQRGPSERRSQTSAQGPRTIVNDTASDATTPGIFSLADLPMGKHKRRSSQDSFDTGSMSPRNHDTEVNQEQKLPSNFQRQEWHKTPDGIWRQDSTTSFSEQLDEESSGTDTGQESSDTDIDDRGLTGEYSDNGVTRIPLRRVSVRAVIDLGYPFVRSTTHVYLQVALSSPMIKELLKLSEKYKRAEADRGRSAERLEHPSPSSSRAPRSSGDSSIQIPEAGTLPKIRILPFFLWKVRPKSDANISANADVILIEMLGKSNKQLRSNKLYSSVYACTLDDLLHRHANFIKATIPPTEASTFSNIRSEDEGGSARLKTNSDMERNIYTDKAFGNEVPATNAQEEIHNEEGKEFVQRFRAYEITMRRIFWLSQELLGTFLPKEGSTHLHLVCKRFWGSLDEIFRHIIWSFIDVSNQTCWVIHDFTPDTTLSKALPKAAFHKKAFTDCDDCNKRKVYESYIEALNHLHSEHMSCTNVRKSKRPHDDPCSVWLRLLDNSQVSWTQSTVVVHAIDSFIEMLTNVKDLAMELHYLVATTSYQSKESGFRPFLPSNVFYAFQEVLIIYFCTSRQLSYINGLESLQPGPRKLHAQPYWRKIRSLEIDARTAFRRACEFLGNSKEDIIRSGVAPQSPDTLGIESVGPHFLAAALAINLQNRPLVPDTDTDVFQIYREFTTKLRYQIYRRPRRRIFLDIHRLQEDLEALQYVVASQIRVLDGYKRLLSPTSFRRTDTAREGLFRIESRYIDSQIDKLRDQIEDIRGYLQRMVTLKEQVKQTIEILEEDHGMAIRVFTIVTVFFLPLSFVTSFFGMNTTDIRDTDYDQRLFWAVSVPITFAVLALAFLYGYKGDAIEDRILTLMYNKSERKQQPLPKKTMTWGTITSENSTTKNTSQYHLPSWVKPVRQRRKLKISGVKRQPTDISYLSM
ncbi:hypothetical protein F4806DRAFT_398504 [Annulohypoxylon nitens]|nr:hypothetical protein F4806DRAFT_398504 [Annulohypoxylon nitens]